MTLMQDLLGKKKQVDFGEEGPEDDQEQIYVDSLLVPGGHRQSTNGSLDIIDTAEMKRKVSKPSISVGSKDSIERKRESNIRKSDSTPMLKKSSVP